MQESAQWCALVLSPLQGLLHIPVTTLPNASHHRWPQTGIYSNKGYIAICPNEKHGRRVRGLQSSMIFTASCVNKHAQLGVTHCRDCVAKSQRLPVPPLYSELQVYARWECSLEGTAGRTPDSKQRCYGNVLQSRWTSQNGSVFRRRHSPVGATSSCACEAWSWTTSLTNSAMALSWSRCWKYSLTRNSENTTRNRVSTPRRLRMWRWR